MKTKPVPTSPKVRNRKDIVEDIYKSNNTKSFDRPHMKHRSRVLILSMAILAGFFAGIFGEVMINALAIAYPNLPVISSLYVRTYPSDDNIVIVKNEKTIEAQEYQLLNTLSKVQSSVVRIFEKKNINPENTELLDQNYQFGNSLGSALILTNDGLIVTSDQVITDMNREYVAVTSDRKVYQAENMIKDNATNLVYFRIAETNLSVAEFVNPQDLHVGKQVIALANKINGMYESRQSQISDLVYYPDNELKDAVYSTERLTDRIKMADQLNVDYLGSPMVTNDGKIVGILISEDNVFDSIIPGEYIQNKISKILSNGIASETFFGVNYVDLSRTTQLDVSIVGNNKIGALVYGNADLSITAVANNSPAKKAGLQENDIILSMGGKDVSSTESLAEIVQSFGIGDQVDIQYIRSGEELTLTGVVLVAEEE